MPTPNEQYDELIPARYLRNYRDCLRSELSAIFDRVKDKKNWKNPIDKEVYLTDDEVSLLREAVVFYTGGEPKIERIFLNKLVGAANKYHVTAPGYYNSVGA